MFVKPAPNPKKPGTQFVVRRPVTMTPIPDEGCEVPPTHYWLRRLRDGDVVKASKAPPTPGAPHPAGPPPTPAKGA